MMEIKKRTFFLLGIIFFICLIIVSLLFIPSENVSPKTIRLTYAASYGPTHPQALADLDWIKKIHDETGGRVEIKPFWAGSLISPSQAYIELSKGVADIAEFSGTMIKEGFDIEKAMRVLFIGISNREVARQIYEELRLKFPEIDAEFKRVKVLERSAIPAYQLLTRKIDVREVNDLKGLALKVSGDTNALIRLFGGEGMAVPLGETYMAIQKGTIDGTVSPYDTLKVFKFAEVVKYATELNLSVGPTPHRGINLNTWRKLPPDIQKVFEDNILFWGTRAEDNLFKTEQEGILFGKQLGVEFINLSPAELDQFYNSIGVFIQAEMEKLDAKGIPGTAIYDEIRNLTEKFSQ